MDRFASYPFVPSSESIMAPQAPQSTADFADRMKYDRAHQHLAEAMVSIPIEEKEAYLAAMETAPEIVQQESDPMLFVRVCNYNFWAAAKRLCRYWSERKNLFKERFCLPLTLTGHGALTSMDVQTLQAGFPAILPDNADGQPTVLTDRRQWVAGATTEHRLRCNFYITKIMMEHPSFKQHGTVHILILLLMPRINDFDPSFVSRTWDLIGHAFPSKAHAHLVCNLPKADKHLYLIQNIIASYVKLVERGCDFADIHLHMSTDEKEVRESLIGAGFSEQGLPTCMGGSWDFIQATEWVRKRLFQEREDLEPPLDDQAQELSPTNSNGFPSMPTKTAKGKNSRSTSTSSNSTTVHPSSIQDAVQKRRVVNAIHSRRKRERRRRELQNLKQEGENCKADNVKLRAENARLGRLLQEAQAIVATLPKPHVFASPPMEQQTDFKRRKLDNMNDSNIAAPIHDFAIASGAPDTMLGMFQRPPSLDGIELASCQGFGDHSFFAHTEVGGANKSLEQTNNHGPDVSPLLFGRDGTTAAEDIPEWSLDNQNEASVPSFTGQQDIPTTFKGSEETTFAQYPQVPKADQPAMLDLATNPIMMGHPMNVPSWEQGPFGSIPVSNTYNSLGNVNPFPVQQQQIFDTAPHEHATNTHLRHHYDPPRDHPFQQQGGEPSGATSRLLGMVQSSAPQERQQVLASLLGERKESHGSVKSKSSSNTAQERNTL